MNMNISTNKNMRGSSSQKGTDADVNAAVPSIISGRRQTLNDGPKGFSIADIRTGSLWSISDYTSAVYTDIEKD